MILHLRLVVFACFFVCSAKLSATTYYVDDTATGTGTGANWTNAFTDLQQALSIAVVGDIIWVAEGIYKPTQTNDRSISFGVPDSVKVYGGFSGNEASLDQRNWELYPTILSGDIGIIGDHSDNSNHVVVTSNTSIETVLDGFKIMYGNFAEGASVGVGGGLYNDSGKPRIRNCVFDSNKATSGGGLTNLGFDDVLIENCYFVNNSAISNSNLSGGGALYTNFGSVTIRDCAFQNNTGPSGGAIKVGGGDLIFDRCNISGNTATYRGGAIYGVAGNYTAILSNCLIVGNLSLGSISAISLVANNFYYQRMYYCTVADNHAVNNNANAVALTAGSTIKNCILRGNTGLNASAVGANGIVSHCLVDDSSVGVETQVSYEDPLFVAPGDHWLAPFVSTGYDYHVQLISPSINHGFIDEAITGYDIVDLENHGRIFGSNPDIGCYEKEYCSYEPMLYNSHPSGLCPNSSVFLMTGTPDHIVWSNGVTEYSQYVYSSGLYSFAADSAGCLGEGTFNVLQLTAEVHIEGPPYLCIGTPNTLTAVGDNIASYMWQTGETTPSIVIAQPLVSVGIVTTDGCEASANYSVSPVWPSTASISGDSIYCQGSSTVLTASGNSNQVSFLWSPTGQTSNVISAEGDGVYTVTITTLEGCTSEASINLTQLPAPQPVVTFANGILSTTAFPSFQWLLNGQPIAGANGANYTPTANGAYSVEVTNDEGCSAISSSLLLNSIDVAEIKSSVVTCYPNPFSDELLIQFNHSESPYVSISLMDMQGRKVFQQQSLLNGMVRIDTRALAQGAYVLAIESATAREVHSLIK